MCLSQTKEKNHKDWLYSGFGNSYSKYCNFFDGYQVTLITLVFNNVEVKKVQKPCFSQTRGKNHEDRLYCGFGNSYSKSCYSFESNQITLEIYLDDTIDSSKQFWSKINPKKACFSQIRGKKTWRLTLLVIWNFLL